MKQNQLLKSGSIILDGATGTELERRGIRIDLPLWSAVALLDKEGRSALRSIHADYIRAGADIITANTFRTNIRTLKKAGLESGAKTLTQDAVEEVRRAVDFINADRQILIAGSVAPVEDCYSPERVPPDTELMSEHHRHIDYLYDAGVDVMLIETMNTIREARIVLEYCVQTGKQVLISYVCIDGEHLFSGEKLSDAVTMAAQYSPCAVLVNCATVDIIDKNLMIIRSKWEGRTGAYANILSDQVNKNSGFEYSLTPAQYAEHVSRWMNNYQASITGGCCGTTPEHIKAIRELP